MKEKFLLIFGILIGMAIFQAVHAQSIDEMLNLLIGKGLIKQDEADSLRAEAAIKAQTTKEKQKNFSFNTSRLLQFSGYIQTRFQSNQKAGTPDGLDIRRARLDIRGDVKPSWEYRLQVDFAGTPKLLDGYAVFKPFDFLKIQAGQFKLPLSPDNIMASGKMEFIDRSQVTEALVSRGKDVLGNHNGRDLGAMIFGSFLKIKGMNFIDYYLGGFNGQGINIADKNESKDFCGRIVFHPVAGLDIGGAYYNGFNNVVIGKDTGEFIRVRTAAELSYSWKRLTIKAEYINGQDGKIRREGLFAQAGYFVWLKKLQVLVKYDQYEPDRSKSRDIASWYIGGINFFFNDYAKLGVNYTYKYEEGGHATNVNNDLISAQLQIGF